MTQEPEGKWTQVSDRVWHGTSVQGEVYVWALVAPATSSRRGIVLGWCAFALRSDGGAVCDGTLHASSMGARAAAEMLLTYRDAIAGLPPDAHGMRTLDLDLDLDLDRP